MDPLVQDPPVKAPVPGSLSIDQALDYVDTNSKTPIIPTSKQPTNSSSTIQRIQDSGSKYDAGYIPSLSLEDYRADNQSGATQLGEGLARLAGGTVLDVAKGFSTLGSAVGVGAADALIGINNGLADDKHQQDLLGLDDITDNPVNNLFYGLEDMMKKALPIYKTDKYNNMNLMQQMMTSGWWADEGADVGAFMVSNILTANALGTVGLGAKVAGALDDAGVFGKIASAGEQVGKMGKLGTYANEVLLGKSGLSSPVEFATKLDHLAQEAYMTTSEAFFMSKDAGEAVTKNYLQQNKVDDASQLNPQQQQELTAKKAQAEKYTFWANIAALSFSSHVETGFVNKIFGHATPENITGLVDLGEGISSDATKVQSEGVSKFFDSKVGTYAKNIPKYALLEGAYKANVQNSISAIATQFGYTGAFDYMKQVAQLAIKNLGDADAYKAMGANLVLGTFMGALGGAKEAKEQEHAINSAVTNINGAKENFVNLNNVLYQRDANNKVVTDSDGTPKYDVPAIVNYAANTLQASDLQDIHDTFKNQGDEAGAKLVKNELFTKYALAHLEAGLGDQFIAKVKSLNSYKDEDLAKLGLDPIEIGPNGNKISIPERTQDLLQQATQIQKDYEQVSRTIGYQNYFNTGNKTGDALQNANLQNARTNEAIKTLSRIRALDDLVNSSQQQVLELQARELQNSSIEPQVSTINSRARIVEAKEEAFIRGVENGNIDPETRIAKQELYQIQELKKSIIEQKQTSKELLEKLGYEINPDFKELLDGKSQSPNILEAKQHLQDIEDAKVAKIGLQDKYNKISDYNTGAEYFVNGAKAKAAYDINVENTKTDAPVPTPVPEISQKQIQVNSLTSKVQNIHDRLTHLTTENNREKSNVLNSIIKPEEIILNEIKGRIRLSSDDLHKQLDAIDDAKVIAGRENTEITNELQRLQANPNALQSDIDELQRENGNNDTEYTKLEDLQSRIEDLSKSLFPEESKAKKEFTLDKSQVENIKQISADLLQLKNDFQSKVDSLNNQSKNYQLELNKLLKSINDKPDSPDDFIPNPPTTSSSPIPAIENSGLFKTAGANSKDGKLTDSYSQKVWGDWANKFNPKNKEGYSLRTVTINDPEYGLNGSRDDLYKEEDKQYQHKDNIKVIIVDKKGNPVYHQGSKVYTSLPEITESKTEPEHFTNFRSENKLLAKQSIEEYRDFANLIKNSKEPLKLQITGKSNGRIVIGEPIDATKAFGKQLPLRIITDDKTTIEGNDYPLPKGLVYVNYNGRPIGAESRTLTPEESKAVLEKLKEYARLRGDSNAVNNKELINQLKGTILLNQRQFNPDLSIYFVKGKNNLTFGDKVISTKDLIDGKYDDQLREFLDNQNLQVDKSTLTKNHPYKDIFDKQWGSYQDYLLSPRENIQDTPLTFKIQPLSDNISKPQFVNTYLTYSKPKLSTEEVKPQEKTATTQANAFEFGTSLPFVSMSSMIENSKSILSQLEPTEPVSNLIKENEGNPTTRTTTTKDEQGTVSGITKEASTDGGRSQEENTTKLQTDLLDDLYLHPDLTKDYQPIDFEKEKQWFKDNVSTTIPFEKVKGLVDKQAYGKFLQAGKVLISDEAIAGTGFHEAFHVVSQLYLSDTERSDLYSKYRKDTNNTQATDRLVEEGLAEEFREYMLTKQSPYKEFFDRIVNFIKQLVGIGNSDKDVLFSRISNGYFSDSNIKSQSDLDLYKMSDHLDASTTKDVLDSMTLTLVRGIFKNNFSLNDIERFNEGLLNEEDSDRFKNLYSSVLATMNQAMLKAAEKQPNGEHIKNVVKYINENKASVQLDHLAYLKKFGINLEVEPDIELPEDYQRAKDTLGIISAIEFSAKSGMPNVIKLMIGSLPKLQLVDGTPKPVYNNLGLPKLGDYRRNIAILQNELSGTSSFKEQMAKVKMLSTRVPDFMYLADQLGVSEGQTTPSNLRADYFDLQSKFRQQFDKAYYNFYTQLYEQAEDELGNKTGERNSYLLDSNTDKLKNIIKARWQGDAFANKNAYVVKAGQYILNPDYFKKTYTEFKNLSEKERISTLLKYYDNFDIPLSKEERKEIANRALSNNNLKNDDKKYQVLSFYKDLGVTFSQKDLVDIDALSDKIGALIPKMQENDISSIFQDEAESKGFVNSIVEQELATSLDYSDNQHINPEGKTVYNVSLHNYLTRLTAEINNFGLPEELQWNEETQQGNPFLRHSTWKDKLEAGKTLKVGIQEGARVNEPGEDGISTASLSTPDTASQQFIAILSGHSPYMRAGDKALEHSFSFGDVPKYTNLDDITNYFKGHLADELLSSYMLNVEGVGAEYPEYANSAKDLRVFKDIFNKTDEARYKAIINDKTIDRAEVIKQIDAFVEEDSSKKALQDWFDKYTEENKQLLLDNNLVNENNGVHTLLGIPTELADKFVGKSDALSEGQMKSLVEQFTYNQLQGNIEQTKIFTGDVAFYKDFFKRTSGLTGTGKSTWVGREVDSWLNENRPREYQSYDGKIKVDKQSDSKIQSLMFNDVKTVSSNFKEYVENLVSKGLNREYANSILDKYGKAYDEGDAQGYLTLPEYREFLTRTGDWTSSHETLYPKLIRGEEISAKDLGNFLSGYAVLKPQYFGKQTDVNGLFVPTFYKFSAMPLISSVVRGTELEELMHTMLETGHGLSIFKTGNKVGAKVGNNLYDENGKINLDADNLTTQELDYASMKIQLDINPKNKGKVIFGTQFRKLVLANLAGKSLTINGNKIDGNRLIKTYSDLIDRTIQIETKNLIDKLGLSDAGNGQFKLSKPEFLRNLLSNEALQRQAPDNLLEGIKQILPEEGGHKQFDLLVSRNKIENILMSLVNNNVIKQKTFGDMRVQGASTGFEAKSGLKGRGIQDAEKATWWSKVEQVGGENSSLSFYKADDSGTKPMEIYLPHYFKELIGKDVDINRIDEKLLNVIGYRTPTQGLNSMELMKIKGFLPQEAGNLIVVPSEIVVKSGSDFDIDKLSLHFPNYEMVDGEPKYLDYDSKNEAHQNDLARIYNRINDLAWKTIAAPENFQSLITPNSNGQAEEIANEVAKMKEDVSSPTDNGKGNNIGWKKNLDIRQAYLSGKEGIGIAAIHNTNHVLNQIVGLKAKPEVKINLEHNKTEGKIDFSKEREVGADPINSPTILDNLSAFLNGLVDMANNPFLSTINTTMDTLPTYLYLIKAGVPLRQAIMFMNQSIISDYLRLSQSNDSLGLKATDNKLSEERLLQKVLDLYPSKQAKLDLTNQSTLDNYKKTITSNKLEEYIKGNPNTAVQQQILLDYLNYKDQADGLSDLIKATTTDTRGTGATMNSAQNVIDNYNKLKENSIFENVEKYMNETFIGSFQKAVEKSVQLYKPVFYTERAEVKNELARIKEVVGLSKFADSEKVMNLAKNDIINYVLQTSPTDGTSIKNLVKDIYQSIAKNIAELKEHPAVANNPLVRELFPTISSNSTNEIGTPNDLDKLKIFSKKLEAVDSNLLTEGWKDLFNLNEQFATNLMVYTIMQSGLNNSPVSFTQYAPNEYYIQLASRLLGETNLDGFYDKFMRNNYQNNDLVPKISKYIMTSQGLYTIADGNEARITPPRRSKITGKLLGKDNTQYPYIKAWNKSLNGYELYKNTNTTTGTNNAQVFERVSKLGDGYNLKEWTDESIILSNRLSDKDSNIRDLSDLDTKLTIQQTNIQDMIEGSQFTEEQKQSLALKLGEAKTDEDFGKILKEICS